VRKFKIIFDYTYYLNNELIFKFSFFKKEDQI